MTTPQDIERLARAINPSAWDHGSHFAAHDRDLVRQNALRDTRAVLTELLNPSERMVAAGYAILDSDDIEKTFQAMLQSILDQESDAGKSEAD